MSLSAYSALAAERRHFHRLTCGDLKDAVPRPGARGFQPGFERSESPLVWVPPGILNAYRWSRSLRSRTTGYLPAAPGRKTCLRRHACGAKLQPPKNRILGQAQMPLMTLIKRSIDRICQRQYSAHWA
jgi:hypothetical protein